VYDVTNSIQHTYPFEKRKYFSPSVHSPPPPFPQGALALAQLFIEKEMCKEQLFIEKVV